MPGAGTDKTKTWIDAGGPIIILVEPQLGENIGAAARVMANFGLRRLRLVKPRDGWPNIHAHRSASGADRVLDEAELYESDRAIIASLLSQAGAGLGFEELAEVGTIHVPQTPAVQFEDLRFPTPSGKIRIAGDCFSDAGLPQAPFPSAEARPGAGDLRLLSPASEWLMNSSFGNEAKVVRQLGKREVFLSSIEAGARNLKDGDLIELGNQTGTLIATLGISDTVPTGVALLHKSRWPKGDEFRANVNVLNPGRKSDLAESCAVHSIDVSLNRA